MSEKADLVRETQVLSVTEALVFGLRPENRNPYQR